MRRATGSGEAVEERARGYRGVRRRRWGKWVSEIRVPGTRKRLWLGSYATPEAAAVAHDTAVFFLRGGVGTGVGGGDVAALNFPERAKAYGGTGGRLSPRSVQRVASDAGMAADAQLVAAREQGSAPPPPPGPAAWHAHHRAPLVGNAHDGASVRPHDHHTFTNITSAGGEEPRISFLQ